MKLCIKLHIKYEIVGHAKKNQLDSNHFYVQKLGSSNYLFSSQKVLEKYLKYHIEIKCIHLLEKHVSWSVNHGKPIGWTLML